MTCISCQLKMPAFLLDFSTDLYIILLLAENSLHHRFLEARVYAKVLKDKLWDISLRLHVLINCIVLKCTHELKPVAV